MPQLDDLPQEECVELADYCCPYGSQPDVHHHHYDDLAYYFLLNPYRPLGHLYRYVPSTCVVDSDGGADAPSRRPVDPMDLLLFFMKI